MKNIFKQEFPYINFQIWTNIVAYPSNLYQKYNFQFNYLGSFHFSTSNSSSAFTLSLYSTSSYIIFNLFPKYKGKTVVDLVEINYIVCLCFSVKIRGKAEKEGG